MKFSSTQILNYIAMAALVMLTSCESKELRGLYDICEQIDHRVSAHLSSAPIFEVEEVSDQQSYRQMLEEELLYFGEELDVLTDCIFENSMYVSESERGQMMDLDRRISGMVFELKRLLEDPNILEPNCSKCAPKYLDLLFEDWFEEREPA